VLAVIGLGLARPHLKRDLDEFFQPLEALFHWRERNAQPTMLLLIPGSADPEIGSPAREHVEGGSRLDQQTRVAIGDARHHGAQADALCLACGECERAPAFEHLFLFGANSPNLEEMIHHPQTIKPGVFGAARDIAKGLPNMSRATRPVE